MPSTSQITVNNSTLQKILVKLGNIKIQQERVITANNASAEKIATIERRMGPVEQSLRDLHVLPESTNRLDTVEKTVEGVLSRISKLEEGTSSDSATGTSRAAGVDAITLAELRKQLQVVQRQNNNTRNEIVVVSSLFYDRETSLRKLAFAVISEHERASYMPESGNCSF